MFSNLKVWQKLSLVGALLSVPILTLVYLFIQSQNKQIATTTNERDGLEYVTALRPLLENVPQHRGLVNGTLNGEGNFRAQLPAIESRIDAAMAGVDTLTNKYGERFGVSEVWGRWKMQWRDVQQRSMQMTPKESFDLHTRLISDLVGLAQMAGDKSDLVLDAELDTFYLADVLLSKLPWTSEYIGEMRDFGAGIAAKGKMTSEDHARMMFLVTQIQGSLQSLDRSVKSAQRYNPSLESKLAGLAANASTAGNAYLGLANAELIRGLGNSDAQKYFNAGTATLENFFKLYDASAKLQGEMLAARVDRLTSDKFTQLSFAMLVLLLAATAVYLISRGITVQVNAIGRLFNEISTGNFQARVEVKSRDELGGMARSLNSMLDNTLALIQSRDERDNIQQSIMKLLEEVAGVASGDLTKEAEVTADVTGAIADSFNYMIAELRQLISAVQQTTAEVTASAQKVQQTTEELAKGSEAQSTQILQASAAIQDMTQSIHQVSSTATAASGVAEQALSSARQGAASVNKTIDGMNQIRGQVQETAKRIKRLGESSQEIGEIVQLIGDIADRTSILALNASIQAAMAGESGKGFAVVAEEVEGLAERAADSAKKITNLIKSVQTDTNEAISAMEETTREVVGGSQLANEAGQKLEEIGVVSQRIAELVQSISRSAQQQASDSENVSRNVTNISQVTLETAQGARRSAAAIRGLASLAGELNQSVSRFRLPEDSRHLVDV